MHNPGYRNGGKVWHQIYEGPKKHHEPQRVPSQVAMRFQTIGQTQRSCVLQSEFRVCHQKINQGLHY